MALYVTVFGKLVSAYVPIYRPSPWSLAHATFYGDESASATMGSLIGHFPLPSLDASSSSVKLQDSCFFLRIRLKAYL